MPSIDLFSLHVGGIADSDTSGQRNSVASLKGADLHSEPGIIKNQQKLTDLFNIAQNEIPVRLVVLRNGDVFFVGNRPKTGGSDVVLRQIRGNTNVASIFIADGQGFNAYHYDGALYVVYRKNDGRILIARWKERIGNITNANVSEGLEQEWNVLQEAADADSNNTFYPIIAIENSLYFGAGSQISREQSRLLTAARTQANASEYKGVFDASTTYEQFNVVSIAGGTNYALYILLAREQGTQPPSGNDGNNIWARLKVDVPRTETISSITILLGVLTIITDAGTHTIVLPSAFNSSLFTKQALVIDADYTATAFSKTEIGGQPYLLIGARYGTEVSSTNAKVFSWNTWVETYQQYDDVPGRTINAFAEIDNGVLASVSNKGALYAYSDGRLSRYRTIPFYEYNKQKEDIVVRRYATELVDNVVLIGAQRVDEEGRIIDSAIYSVGSHSNQYPYVFNREYEVDKEAGETIEYIDIISHQDNILVLYQKQSSAGTRYHIAEVSRETVQATEIITPVNIISEDTLQRPAGVSIFTRKSPEGTSITLEQKVKGVWKDVPVDKVGDVYTGNDLNKSSLSQFRVILRPNMQNQSIELIGITIDY